MLHRFVKKKKPASGKGEYSLKIKKQNTFSAAALNLFPPPTFFRFVFVFSISPLVFIHFALDS